MKQILGFSLVVALAACSPKPEAPPAAEPASAVAVADPCIPAGKTRADLDALKEQKFEIADADERQAFAAAITACLGSPDPSLRDGIAYEALTHLMRNKQLAPETLKALMADLTAKLEGPEGDGFMRPFAVLALSEVARTDRVEAWLTDAERNALAATGQGYVAGITDYRGFDVKEGWRHGVAHGSDLLMQLALNPKTSPEALGQIIAGARSQVAPRTHSYIHGESERLARPVLFAAARGIMIEGQWAEWLMQVATPPQDIAGSIYTSMEGLAWKHNTLAFLQALYMNVTLNSDKADDVMLKGLDAALKAVP